MHEVADPEGFGRRGRPYLGLLGHAYIFRVGNIGLDFKAVHQGDRHFIDPCDIRLRGLDFQPVAFLAEYLHRGTHEGLVAEFLLIAGFLAHKAYGKFHDSPVLLLSGERRADRRQQCCGSQGGFAV